jgi:hypothetical protein
MSDRFCNECNTLLSHREHGWCLACQSQSSFAAPTLLAALVESEKDAWKELDRAIAAADYVAKCMDRARDEWAKAYAAVKTAEREQAANAEVRDPAT